MLGEDPGACSWHAAWGKTARDEAGRPVEWLPLHQHLADTAGVAGRLIDEWASPQAITKMGEGLPGGAEDVRALAVWLAAVHDVGKASPGFLVQVPEVAVAADRHGLLIDLRLGSDPERSAVSHQLVGNQAVEAWLNGELSLEESGQQLASIVGSHHGLPPVSRQLLKVDARTDLAGDGAWIEARSDILDWATELIGGPDVLRRLAGVSVPITTQVALCGIVIVADWIASDADHFPLLPLHTVEAPPSTPNAAHTTGRVVRGWASVDLPSRWRPVDLGDDASTVLEARFDRADTRPIQRAAVEIARAAERPGLMVIEAPMGEGKTEAALLAAEILAARTGADGCFIALPTRATSDAMFSRVLPWIDRLPGWKGEVGVRLAHGTASLNDKFTGLVRLGRLASIGEDVGESALAHVWFRGRKRAALAQFVVGTIDQVLFAALKSKHLMLRHLGLAGKVVVIDEVHAYDTYMAEFLFRALHWLGAYGVPVVLLSATLPAARRAALVRAYDRGAGTISADVTTTGYPSVTASGGSAPVPVAASGRKTTVTITRFDEDPDDPAELIALLEDRLADGGCAVVVRNTVGRVQSTAEHLARAFGDDAVTVNHSRFLACDRATIDRELLRRFGPPEEAKRPTFHIVVASQVVEQSLDVDFDLMVTDLAPIDLLLQRMGRLHRHDRPRPTRLSEPECVLVGVASWGVDPVQAVVGSRRVYSEHALLRAAALMIERERVDLPAAIADLVEDAYGDAILGPPSWQQAMTAARRADEARARERRRNADTYRLGEPGTTTSLVNWIKVGVGEADDEPRRGVAQVRDGVETLEVIVLQRDGGGGFVVPDWIPSQHAGEPVPVDFEVPYHQARALAACALRLPLALSHGGVIDKVIAELERTRLTSFEVTPLLRGSLVLALDPDRTRRLTVGGSSYLLAYSVERGLTYQET